MASLRIYTRWSSWEREHPNGDIVIIIILDDDVECRVVPFFPFFFGAHPSCGGKANVPLLFSTCIPSSTVRRGVDGELFIYTHTAVVVVVYTATRLRAARGESRSSHTLPLRRPTTAKLIVWAMAGRKHEHHGTVWQRHGTARQSSGFEWEKKKERRMLLLLLLLLLLLWCVHSHAVFSLEAQTKSPPTTSMLLSFLFFFSPFVCVCVCICFSSRDKTQGTH